MFTKCDRILHCCFNPNFFFFFKKEYDRVLRFYYENVKYKNTCYLWSLFLGPYETVFLDLIMD